MKKIYYILLAVITLATANSCSKFDQLNTNPNAAATVSPDMLATQVLKNTYRFWNPNPTDFGTAALQDKYVARLDGSPNGGQYYSPYPYGGFGWFKNLTDTKRMVEFAKGLPTESSFKGLALFLKAYWGYSMTMDMGDVPYSEAGQAEAGITRPKYDKQSDVFVGVLKDLQAAEALFAAGKNFGSCDIMYGGDVTKWRKLCNTWQLKILQMISKKATADQKARFAAIVSANNLMVGNADNYVLAYSDNPNATHPFYTGESARLVDAVSKLAVDALKNLNDRRLFYFAEPALYLIKGGKLESDFYAYEGAPTELSAGTLALNKQSDKYSLINKRYTLLRSGDPMLQLTYSEQCFIIAEAIEEGWIAGNAKDYYENGAKAMLSYYMTLPSASSGNHGMAITQTYIDNYFTGAAAYNTSGTKLQREQQLWMQRWLIDFFQGNAGYYKNYLRTQYPVYPLDPATNMNPDDKTTYPKRLMYPTSEQVANPDNYQKAITDQFGGYDGINKIPWWLQ